MEKISNASSTKERLRLYFEYYKDKPITVDKLSVIAKTREWTRQLRYIRAENNMDIEYTPKNKEKGILTEYYTYHGKKEK